MRTAKCKCGERQTWGQMPPCAICEKCGTAPGYVNAEKPAPHRFSKKFDQNTGKPFNYCMVCGRKEEVLFEPKCAECGHEYGVCIEAPDGCSWSHPQTGSDCLCPGYRPAEPDATDEDFKIEPISQHTLKVPVQYKGQAEPLDFTEPDATERARAWVQKQTGRFELDNPLLEADIADLAAFLESEAPRIRADERKKAVREFVTRFKKNVGYLSHPVVKEMMVEQMIKEMTEVD